MPIPNADRAIVDEAKVRNYLLNPAHPDGGSKAIWFQSIGYCDDDWQDLRDDLLMIAKTCTAFDIENTRFGIKYKARGIIGRSKRTAVVLTVWIDEGDGHLRLITAYPALKT